MPVYREITRSITQIEFEEVILIFSDELAANTPFNIQTGVYAGGGPATVQGDNDMELPDTTSDFNDDGRIIIALNGQTQNKGNDVLRVSTTQIQLDKKIFPDNQILVRI